jgi:hypothetical protein
MKRYTPKHMHSLVLLRLAFATSRARVCSTSRSPRHTRCTALPSPKGLWAKACLHIQPPSMVAIILHCEWRGRNEPSPLFVIEEIVCQCERRRHAILVPWHVMCILGKLNGDRFSRLYPSMSSISIRSRTTVVQSPSFLSPRMSQHELCSEAFTLEEGFIFNGASRV